MDAIAAGQKYELLRRKLVSFFQWRGAASPEDLADETIARVGGRLDHCYRIAKLVLMRWQKGAEDQRAALSGAASMPLVDQDGDAGIRRCLERCLQYSEVSQRNLILSYYQGERLMKIYSRKRLALEMGISTEALRIRAHRIRARLEESVRASIRRQGHSKNAMEDMT